MTGRARWVWVGLLGLAACAKVSEPPVGTGVAGTATGTGTGTGSGTGTGTGSGTGTGTGNPDAPNAVDDAMDVPWGDQVQIDVLSNDSDPDGDLDPDSVTVISSPSHGQAVVQVGGTIGYRHDGIDPGPDSLTYVVSDLAGNVSAEATVDLTIVNTAPVAVDDARTVGRGAVSVVNLAANDIDPDDGLDLASIQIGFQPVNGSLVVQANGTVSYTHDGSYTASDSFTYTILDNAGQISNSATVNLTIVEGGGCGPSPGLLYAIQDDVDLLVTIDPATLAFTTVGPLSTPFDFGELAYDCNNDVLYMVDGRQSNSLFTLDRATGTATLVGFHGINDMFGLTYDSANDVLYGNTGGGDIYVLDRVTGAATWLGASNQGIGALAYDSLRDQLVMVGLSGNVELIDRATGTVASNLYGGAQWLNDHGSTYDPSTDLFWSIGWSGTLHTHDAAAAYFQTQLLTGLAAHDGVVFVPL